jgi:hemerythrin-like metal-binding protein
MSLAWDPGLATGNRQIDAQHERIFQICNELRVAIERHGGAGEVGRVLGTLSIYVVAHFRLEEELMARTGFGGLDAHRAAHEALRLRAEELVDQYKAGGLAPMALLDFMEHWLDDHVQNQDQPMVRFVTSVLSAEG